MTTVFEEEYINPFHILVDEEYFFNLNSGIPVNNLQADKILLTEELGKNFALAFATVTLVENGAKFHEALPKTKLPSFENPAKSVTV